MTDAETLRAAAEVLRRRGFVGTAVTIEQLAQNVEAEAAARDWPLAKVAADAFSSTFGTDVESEERWLITARAVGEAIEAGQ